MNLFSSKSVLSLASTLLLVVCVALVGIKSLAQSDQNERLQSGDLQKGDKKVQRSQNDLLLPKEDGWHTWTVDAVENAPNWCCVTWRSKGVTEPGCELEGNKYSYGISSDNPVKFTDVIRVYAQIENGETKRVRAFGSQCPVVATKKIIDHGRPGTAASLDWLSAQLDGDRHVIGQSLGVIAAHDSVRAQTLLVDATRQDRKLTTRKDALFWMGQVRARQSESDLTRLLREGDVPELREHAVFSISQSSLTNKIALIDGAARKDRSAKVRGQAWFWMAQTEDADAEKRIRAGMESESDRGVLDQAIFALSQLPSESGVAALIGVIEDERFDRELRKKALFWLAQSSSDQAVNYIAEVLNR